MTGDLTFTLQEFTKDRKFNRKGPLSVALVVTQQARNMGLPLELREAFDRRRRASPRAWQERCPGNPTSPWN